MILNNVWTNDEDDWFFMFNSYFQLSKDNVTDELYRLNKELHELTKKYQLLMTLSPDYCEKKSIDYSQHYSEFLLENKTSILPLDGYEFYTRNVDALSKIYYFDENKKITSDFVHYMQNGLYGNPVIILNEENSIKNNKGLIYDSSPLRISYPTGFKYNNRNDYPNIFEYYRVKDKVTVSFTIESYCSIWLDYIPIYKYLDSKGRIGIIENADNRELAYQNTPRLNSFLRDIQYLSRKYDGYSEFYDRRRYKKELNLDVIKSNKGIFLENRIVYQEEINTN
ncbi:hypothetical protein [Tenacibaculum jejuense]|uniref:Uncharacterized protein n=1 Tax=Tenacibaculum jejuense TaxID=584609 RepID=A0A238U9Y8_9FLAO|nr:hypothetical protein [Tenacibaculum jejuense]SNR15999.1 Protein of unknown function [Tenacibaculum jejuense]